MPDIPSPRWSDRRFTPGVDAVMSWDVKANSEQEAIDLVTQYTGVQQYVAHGLDSSLVADAPAVTATGPVFWRVTYTFKPPGQSNGNATDYRPKFRWTLQTQAQAVDEDAYGNVLLNAAGDVFDGVTRDFNDRGFVVRRREAQYDLAKASEYENTINDAEIWVLGQFVFTKHELRLVSYIPTGEYDFQPNFIMCEYTFLVRRDKWKHRLLNKGNRGWYGTGPDIGNFTDAKSGDTTITDVMLDDVGKPINDRYRVTGQAPVANPAGKPAGATFDKKPGRQEYFAEYEMFPEKNFMGLEL